MAYAEKKAVLYYFEKRQLYPRVDGVEIGKRTFDRQLTYPEYK